jgi:hypothetical protein
VLQLLRVLDRDKCELLLSTFREISSVISVGAQLAQASAMHLEELRGSEDVLGLQQEHINLLAMSDMACKRMQGVMVVGNAFNLQVGAHVGSLNSYT